MIQYHGRKIIRLRKIRYQFLYVAIMREILIGHCRSNNQDSKDARLKRPYVLEQRR